MQIKRQGDTTTHRPKWPKSGALTAPHAGEDVVGASGSLTRAGGDADGATMLEERPFLNQLNLLLHNPAIPLLFIQRS